MESKIFVDLKHGKDYDLGMIKLEEIFKSGMAGFGAEQLTYTLVKRNERVAIYERSRENGVIKDVEVFLVKVVPKGTVIFGSEPSKEDREMYCANSEFGRTAFSYHNSGARSAAIKKFDELNQLKEEIDHPSSEKEIIVPEGEWTTNMLADANSTNYITASLYIKENLNKTIKFLYEKNTNPGGRGKKSKFYAAI